MIRVSSERHQIQGSKKQIFILAAIYQNNFIYHVIQQLPLKNICNNFADQGISIQLESAGKLVKG